jgi:hypothetical protein
MKFKLIAILSILYATGNIRLEAQKLLIWKTDGTQVPFYVSTLQTLSFSGGTLVVKNSTNGTDTYSLSSLKMLVFDNSTSVKSLTAAYNYALNMYFNNSDETLYIKNVSKNNTPLVIYRINGTIALQSKVASGDPSISVSTLPSGFYLAKINNQVFKFIKQ